MSYVLTSKNAEERIVKSRGLEICMKNTKRKQWISKNIFFLYFLKITGPTGASTTGTLTFTEGTAIPSAANIDNYDISNNSFFKITGTTASTISGLSNGVSGRFIIIVNNTDKNQTLQQENTSSLANNRFVLGVSNKTIDVNQTITFIYVTGLTVGGSGSQSRWVMTAST